MGAASIIEMKDIELQQGWSAVLKRSPIVCSDPPAYRRPRASSRPGMGTAKAARQRLLTPRVSHVKRSQEAGPMTPGGVNSGRDGR